MNNESQPERPLNIVFAGTPDFAARHLASLYASNHKVIAVYTQPDRPAGRGKKLTPSPVKVLAQEHGTDVYQPLNFKSVEAQQTLQSLQPDIMIVVAYGIILPQLILNIPKLGCLNVHGSLLPRWRGAAPIQRAIWAGDKFTGISIMQMDEGLDTGPVLLEKSLAITPCATSATLYEDLAELGTSALIEALDNLPNLTPVVQDDSEASYAHKLSKAEAQINWATPALQLCRNVRAFNPWPAAWFELSSQAIKVWQAEVVEAIDEHEPGTVVDIDSEGIEVATAKHNLRLEIIQLAGKKPQSVAEVLNGNPHLFSVGQRIS